MTDHDMHAHDREVLSGRSASVPGRLFGATFAAFGAFAVWAYFTQDIQGEPLAALIVGSLFLIFGLAFIGGRLEIAYIRSRGVVENAWGVFFLLFRRYVSAEKFQHVEISKEIRTSRSSKGGTRSYLVYPVKLMGEESLEVDSPRNFQQARRRAERVAKVLQLPLHDTSAGGEASVRQVHELDMTLAERARRDGEVADMPVKPVRSEVEVRHTPNGVSIELPKPPLYTWKDLIGLAISIGIIMLVESQLGILSGDWPAVAKVIVAILLFSPVWVREVKKLIERLRPQLIDVDTDGIAVSGGVRFFGARRIKKQNLEELYLNGHRIVAVSDARRLLIKVPSNMQDAEFVFQVIRHYMTR
ncbi:MAG: hypothetical protein MJA83_12185 [Gammaproteobacteria bacterium]|nr:hypothetical protein [Gammaproteobacteria bacterium]